MNSITLNIISNGMDGEGIAKKDGKVYFVDGGVDGDTITAKVTKNNKSFARAKMEGLIIKSRHRQEPLCPYFFACGGCALQHINYEKQLQIKTQNVQNLFYKNKLNFNVENCTASANQFGYRNKITLYLDVNNQLSFFEKNSNNLINIEKCFLVDEQFNKLINILNNFFRHYIEFNHFVIKGLAIRKINEKFIINLILTKKINTNKLQNYLKLNKINYAIYYCINTKNNSNLPTYPCYFDSGINEIYLNEFGVKYPIYPMSFLQVNNEVKTSIYNQILEFVKCQNNVLDAYSGAGLLSAIISKNCHKVFAVEIDISASKACEDLCRLNNIKNVQSINGDCANVVPEILQNNQIGCIILDPARKGVDKNVLDAICQSKIKNVIYLSCNPATLTRDLKILCDNGYEINFAKPYDMFPQTAEVETLVKLTLN
ncbi:MAG: 23S rRNA (uracil(1939)-C(5))-methyltransferase RlmD [Clostridiales bacterium]|nr:23S rRNA (uracil(1939)-C(5))-methyltransferase RlmD [Clostridiales bacterium]